MEEAGGGSSGGAVEQWSSGGGAGGNQRLSARIIIRAEADYSHHAGSSAEGVTRIG